MIKLPLDLIIVQGNEFLMRCSNGSKYVRTEHRTESNLEPFDTGSVRTGTLPVDHSVMAESQRESVTLVYEVMVVQ